MEQIAIENLAKAVRIIKYFNPKKINMHKGRAVKKKYIIKEFFLPKKESADHHAKNIVGISINIPTYN